MSTKVGFLFLLGWASTTVAAGAQSHPRTVRDPELHTLYHHDISRPLREMAVIPPIAEEGEERLQRLREAGWTALAVPPGAALADLWRQAGRDGAAVRNTTGGWS